VAPNPVDFSSDFQLSDDLVDNFNSDIADAMDRTTAAAYESQKVRASSLPAPKTSSASLGNLFPHSPPKVTSDLSPFPEGYPFQPIRFNEDVTVMVPITRNNAGLRIEFIYLHLKRLSEKVITANYDLHQVNKLPVVDAMLSHRDGHTCCD
jgi:hypothetical protein